METFDSFFQSGIKNYQEKKYSESVENLKKALEKEPLNPTVMTDLALAQYQLGQKAWALALLRHALSLNPEFSTARSALEFVSTKLEVKDIPHEITWNETLHQNLLGSLSFFWFMILSALFFLAAAWSLMAYLGSLRRSKQEKSIPPKLSFLMVLFQLGFLVLLTLTILKFLDQRQIRGTIVSAEKLSVLSSPDEKAPALFEIYPGLEVIVDNSVDQGEKHWLQITYPGGPTGWLPKSSIEITTEN